MTSITCPSCGSRTNTASCPDWWNDNMRVKCTAKYIIGKGFEKGCGYEQASAMDRRNADKLIADKQSANSTYVVQRCRSII